MQYYCLKFYHLDFKTGVEPYIIDVPVTSVGRDDTCSFHKYLVNNTGFQSIDLETAYEERLNEYYQKMIYENKYANMPVQKYNLLRTVIQVFNKLIKLIPVYLLNKDSVEILSIFKFFISVLNTCIEMLDEKHILTPIFFNWEMKADKEGGKE